MIEGDVGYKEGVLWSRLLEVRLALPVALEAVPIYQIFTL